MTIQPVHVAFDQVAARRPDATAVDCAGRSTTYGALNAAADGVAALLRGEGVGPEAVVGVWLPPGIDYVTALLGVMKSGGAVLPLDPATPARRLETMLQTARPRLVLTANGQQPSLQQALAGIGLDLPVRSIDRLDRQAANPAWTGQPNDTAYLIFTSGSTGLPKAIAGRHDSLAHFIQWEILEFGLDSRCRVSMLAPPTFDVSLRDIFAPLLSGGVLCIPPPETRAQIPALLDWLEAAAVTQIHCVPSLFRRLVHEVARRPSPALPSLQRILLAGEALYAGDIRPWRERMGERIELVNLYGPTETTLAKAFYRIRDIPQTGSGIIPVGQPIPGARLLILRDGELCGPEAIGEIHVQTTFRSKGYYGDPALTAERFIPNPLTRDPQDIVYRTGDQGRYLADGSVEFLGRLDHQVKFNGVRLELGEVEHALRRHAGVQEAAASVQRDAQGEDRLAVFYTAATSLNREALFRHLADYLLPAMMPSFLIQLDEMPLNLHGKVDRRALPRAVAMQEEGQDFSPPQGETEILLARIWSDVLKLKQASADRSFVALGGDSLSAMRVIAETYRVLGVELSLRVVLEQGTIRRLAQWVEARRPKPSPPPDAAPSAIPMPQTIATS